MSAERLEITSSERPENSAPSLPEGELGRLKRQWAEEGCQVPDCDEYLLDKLRWKIEHERLDDQAIMGLLDGLLALNEARAISKEVCQQATAILEPLLSGVKDGPKNI